MRALLLLLVLGRCQAGAPRFVLESEQLPLVALAQLVDGDACGPKPSTNVRVDAARLAGAGIALAELVDAVAKARDVHAATLRAGVRLDDVARVEDGVAGDGCVAFRAGHGVIYGRGVMAEANLPMGASVTRLGGGIDVLVELPDGARGDVLAQKVSQATGGTARWDGRQLWLYTDAPHRLDQVPGVRARIPSEEAQARLVGGGRALAAELARAAGAPGIDAGLEGRAELAMKLRIDATMAARLGASVSDGEQVFAAAKGGVPVGVGLRVVLDGALTEVMAAALVRGQGGKLVPLAAFAALEQTMEPVGETIVWMRATRPIGPLDLVALWQRVHAVPLPAGVELRW